MTLEFKYGICLDSAKMPTNKRGEFSKTTVIFCTTEKQNFGTEIVMFNYFRFCILIRLILGYVCAPEF